MSKVFALGLSFFSGAFLLALVLALGLLSSERGGMPWVTPWHYVALLVLFVAPLYELSVAFRGLASRSETSRQRMAKTPLQHVLVGVGLVVLFVLVCAGI